MKIHRRFALVALPVALCLAATSSAPPTEKVDLKPRFTVGQTLVVSQSFQMDGALENLAVTVDGTEVLGDGVGLDVEGEGTAVYSEEILEVRDGAIAKMRITVEEQEANISGDVDAMGESESMDESIDTTLVGHTFELVIDEDGEVEVTDVTEDPVEAADEDEMNGMTPENHFEEFLPTEPVEVGVEFALGDDWLDRAREFMEDSSEMEDIPAEQVEMVRSMMDAMFDGTTIEATGKVVEVDGGLAKIEYELGAIMAIDDLVSLVAQALPPEMGGEIPPGVEASLEINLEFEGEGLFDLRVGQMTELDLEGEYEVIFTGSADVEGQSAAADASMSGSLKLGSTILVE
ncbi:MAG: hypothetical protein AAGB93_11695 [Planctomycetota bacterium]